MSDQIELLEKLCRLNGLSSRQGYADTSLEEVKLFRISSNEEMMPLLYNRGISFLGQGKKVGYVLDKRFEHTSDDFLIITTPQPIDCKTFVYENSAMMGLYLNLNMIRLHRVGSKLNQLLQSQLLESQSAQKEIPFSVVVNRRTDDIEAVYERLLRVLADPVESQMLGESLLDELYFRILQSENGTVLRQLCEQENSFARVSTVVQYIHDHLEEKIHIEYLAELAKMSVNNFHRVFKEAMNDTPIQYIKKIRLSRARQLILYSNSKAVEAAYSVGYESPTQFSREFKRFFGVSPSKISSLGYENF